MEAMASRTYDGGKKRSRIFARIVALLALGGVSVVLVVVISHSLDSGTAAPSKHQASAAPKHHSAPPDSCYTVQSGDVFSNIAKHEHVIQRTLIQRNGGASFDAQSLQPGQQVNILPNGCK